MSTDNIFAWSGTPGSNTDVAGNGITGSSNLSLGNDVFQNIMAQLANGAILRGTDIATAATLDFTAVGVTNKSLIHDLTGTVTVTAVTLTASQWRLCRATGVFQFTASATLVVNGSTSVNYTTTAGDLIVIFGYGSSTVRVWAFTGGAVVAATTTSSGIVELATVAEAATGTDAVRAVTPAGLYFPTGHLFGLTLSTNATDATNDIDIAAGTARDASDGFNYVVSSAIGKQLDVAWALGGTPGTTTGGLDTGAVGNSRYAIWGIGRSDTQVRNVLFSLSFTAPTMPTNYDYKVLLGEVTRAGGVNGTPLWYGRRKALGGYDGVNVGTPVASTSGASIDFSAPTGLVPRRVTVLVGGISSTGTSDYLIQIGGPGGIETSGYLGSSFLFTPGTVAGSLFTTGFGIVEGGAAQVTHGAVILSLLDQSLRTWVASGTLSRSDAAVGVTSAGSKTVAGALDRVRFTTVGGADTFDLGKINVLWE